MQKDKNMKILVINGPNLNMLGVREPQIYGSRIYADLCKLIRSHAKKRGVRAVIMQSNHEGVIVEAIQKAWRGKVDGIVINPAAYTHTSVAIADALKAVSIPFVEVHISAVDKREGFRQISYIRDFALATVSGEGFEGYLGAMDILIDGKEKNEG